MTDPNEPDKKNEEIESTKDEAIIELTEEAEEVTQEDEVTINLVDAVEESSEEQAPTELKEETTEENKSDEDIIDLLEAAEEQKTVEALEDSEGIIDLTEVAEESDKEVQSESVDTEKQKSTEEDTVIDLTVTISKSPKEIEDIGEPIVDEANVSQESDDADNSDADLIQETIDFTDEIDTTLAMDEASKGDIANSLDVEINAKEDISDDISKSDKISDEQLEAALERVIKKVFYEKIDSLLAEAIEKTVTREIERLKKALLKELPDS